MYFPEDLLNVTNNPSIYKKKCNVSCVEMIELLLSVQCRVNNDTHCAQIRVHVYTLNNKKSTVLLSKCS